MNETFEQKMAEVGDRTLEIISEYFSGTADPENDLMVERAFKFIGHPIKVLHMKQHKEIQERSQGVQLLNFLPNDEVRQHYITITQPEAAPLLAKPQKRK